MARGQPKSVNISASKNPPLVKLLISQSAKLELSLNEIGNRVGWKHSSTVSSVLKGEMAIPIDKIKPLSECLEIDPVALLKLSRPKEFEVLQSIFRTYPTTDNERALLDMWREANNGQNTLPETHEEKEALKTLVGQIAKRKAREVRPSLERLDEKRTRSGFKPKWVKEFGK